MEYLRNKPGLCKFKAQLVSSYLLVSPGDCQPPRVREAVQEVECEHPPPPHAPTPRWIFSSCPGRPGLPGRLGGVLSTGGRARQTCTEEWKAAQHNPWKSNSNGNSCVLGVVWNTQKDREEKKFYRKEKKCSANLDNEDEKSKDAQELKAYYNCKRLMY